MKAQINSCVVLLGLVLSISRPGVVHAETNSPSEELKKQWREEMVYHDAPFKATLSAGEDVEACRLFEVEMPSPVHTASDANNRIRGYYYRPAAPTRAAVIILPVANSPQLVPERVIASYLAHHGFKAFVMPLPYQLWRGEEANARSILSLAARDMDGSLVHEAGRQSVLDTKRVRQWLVRDEGVDPDRIGVAGLSLGSLAASVAYSTDDGFRAAVLVFGGGDLGDVIWNGSRETLRIKNAMLSAGKDHAWATQLTAPLDPLNFANPARRDGILMINAADDQVFPRKCSDDLNAALGHPPMELLPGNHYTAGFYAPLIVSRIGAHMTARLLNDHPTTAPASP